MSISDDLLVEFGHSLGLDGLAWSDTGVVVLDFANRGVLYLEDQDEVLLVYLVRDIDVRESKLQLLHTALTLCHYREGLPYVVQVGLRGEASLVFLVRFMSYEVTLPELERVLELLSQLHDNVQE